LFYNQRINFDLSCPMNFKNYPVDKQRCDIRLESWAHSDKKILFKWIQSKENGKNEDIASQINETLSQHHFKVKFLGEEDDDGYKGISDVNYSTIIYRILLYRKPDFHYLRTYLPSGLFVMVAWFSMFVPLNHVPGRVTMAMTTLLTLASMFGSLTNVTPPISYHTRLDIWMISCIVFVFATLAEFTIVIFLKYYLPHLPLDWFHKLCIKARTPPSSATSPSKPNSKSSLTIDERTNAWVTNQHKVRQRVTTPVMKILDDRHDSNIEQHNMKEGSEKRDDDDTESIPDEQLLDERKEMAEKVIKIIDKYSVIIFFISFSIFLSVYWYSLLTFFYDR